MTSRSSRSSTTSSSGRLVSRPRAAIARRSRDVLRPETLDRQQSAPWTTTDVHARPGVLRGGMAFYSTPSDLVRFALATNADTQWRLAGGT